MTSIKSQLCVALATSLPSSTINQSTGEDNNYYNVLNKILCMLTVTVVSYL